MNLALTTRMIGEVAVVHCGGRLIFQKEAAALCELTNSLVRRHRSIILDLSGVEAIDGSGLGTLAECVHNAREAGVNLVLCCVPNKVRTLLDLTRISSLVEIAPTEHDALERSRAAA